jgi:hypothetical protein
MAALAPAKNREVLYGAALALAIAGDSSQAQTLTNDLEKSFPEDTSVKFNYLPSVRAFLALNHGDPAKAIEILQVAAPYELGQPRSFQTGFFGALYPNLCARPGVFGRAPRRRGGQGISEKFGTPRYYDWGSHRRTRSISNWVERLPSRATTKQKAPITSSSPSGKTPIPTFLSSSRPRQSTRVSIAPMKRHSFHVGALAVTIGATAVQ